MRVPLTFWLIFRSYCDLVYLVLFGGKCPFRCLVVSRLGLHFLPTAIDLARFTGVFIFVHRYCTSND